LLVLGLRRKTRGMSGRTIYKGVEIKEAGKKGMDTLVKERRTVRKMKI